MPLNAAAKTEFSCVSDLSCKLQELSQVYEVCHKENNVSLIYKRHPWNSLSLCEGIPSLMLFFGMLDQIFLKEEFDQVVYKYVLELKDQFEKDSHLGISIFLGLPGICFALDFVSKKGTRYGKMRQTLKSYLLNAITKNCGSLKQRLNSGILLEINTYDVISGITGAGFYLLKHREDAEMREVLFQVIEVLVHRCQPIKVEQNFVPGWYVPREMQFLETEKNFYPRGNFNLGMAHGVTGLLAFFSLCRLHGIVTDELNATIKVITNWLISHQNNSNDLWISWERMVSFEDEVNRKKKDSFSIMDCWCYGTAGVGRAIYLAGLAAANQVWINEGIRAYDSIVHRYLQGWLPESTGLCHGLAGSLMMMGLMARDTNKEAFYSLAHHLSQKLMDSFGKAHPFSFKIIEKTESEEVAELDHVGLLEGSIGIALSLLSHKTKDWSWSLPFGVDHKAF